MTREDNEPKDLVLAEIEEMAAALRNDMQELKDALSGVEKAVASLGGAAPILLRGGHGSLPRDP